MIDRGADQRQAERDVDREAEALVLQHRQPLIVVHREHRVRVPQLRLGEQRIGRQRFAGGIDGGATDQVFVEREVVAVLLGDGLQHGDRRGGDFRADAVAGQGDDAGFHAWVSSCVVTVS